METMLMLDLVDYFLVLLSQSCDNIKQLTLNFTKLLW